MGNEIVCRASLGAQTSEGKALLESDHLLFRGEFRCKVFFRDLVKVSAGRGTLSLFGPEGELRLELGKKATVWSEKILHPKSRAEKLGLKAATKVLVMNLADTEFQAELAKSAVGITAARSKSQSDLVFLGVEDAPGLVKIPDLVPRFKERGALWIVYPKGQSRISESAVIQAGRAAGLKDVKVVSFSSTQTALKFVRPLQP
jgi:hypothetical protein